MIGPIVNDKPNVAKARPYAGARSFGSTKSAMYANAIGNVAENKPDNACRTPNTQRLLVKVSASTGIVVPSTVANRHVRLPIRSLSFPNSGQARNARIPRTASTTPTR